MSFDGVSFDGMSFDGMSLDGVSLNSTLLGGISYDVLVACAEDGACGEDLVLSSTSSGSGADTIAGGRR